LTLIFFKIKKNKVRTTKKNCLQTHFLFYKNVYHNHGVLSSQLTPDMMQF